MTSANFPRVGKREREREITNESIIKQLQMIFPKSRLSRL